MSPYIIQQNEFEDPATYSKVETTSQDAVGNKIQLKKKKAWVDQVDLQYNNTIATSLSFMLTQQPKDLFQAPIS